MRRVVQKNKVGREGRGAIMSAQHVIYLPEFHAIVCRKCQHGISKDGLGNHFLRRHKELELNVRKELERYVETLEVLEPPKVEVPTTEIMLIEGLKVLEGFICMVGECRYLAGTPRSMEEHCRNEHEWTLSQGE